MCVWFRILWFCHFEFKMFLSSYILDDDISLLYFPVFYYFNQSPQFYALVFAKRNQSSLCPLSTPNWFQRTAVELQSNLYPSITPNSMLRFYRTSVASERRWTERDISGKHAIEKLNIEQGGRGDLVSSRRLKMALAHETQHWIRGKGEQKLEHDLRASDDRKASPAHKKNSFNLSRMSA